MTNQYGGKRKGAGRPKTGTTKSISLTLSDEIWNFITQQKEKSGVSQSQILRIMIEKGYLNK